MRTPVALSEIPSPEASKLSGLLAEIRLAQGLDEIAFAWFLETAVETVRALEAGALRQLPPWPETERVVGRWLGLGGIDPRPILASLEIALAGYVQAERSVSTVPRSAADAGIPQPPPAAQSIALAGAAVRLPVLRSRRGFNLQQIAGPWFSGFWLSRRSGFRRSAPEGLDPTTSGTAPAPQADRPAGARRISARARWALAAAVILATVWSVGRENLVVASVLRELPPPAKNAVRSISDFFAVRFAPSRAGHRWIDVADPASRRSDKLQIGRRSD
ncbi:MAG: hypothetical protein KDJ37_16680 [Hyphomicrobiaceae bacterium]|nr:hypothetical protein [Hyphomicrobiaceae bacterium]